GTTVHGYISKESVPPSAERLVQWCSDYIVKSKLRQLISTALEHRDDSSYNGWKAVCTDVNYPLLLFNSIYAQSRIKSHAEYTVITLTECRELIASSIGDTSVSDLCEAVLATLLHAGNLDFLTFVKDSWLSLADFPRNVIY